MSLTSALFTSLTGLSANSLAIQVSGDNIANSNTPGYKASRIDFETSLSQTVRPASEPLGESGGTNGVQIGLGVNVGAITRHFTNGSLSPTGRNTDMAIEGNGFFQVNQSDSTFFTRAGNFALDSEFKLVAPNGGRVQGFGVDSNFNVLEGQVGDITVPVGSLTLAEATRNVRFDGNLNANGDVAMQGTLINTTPLFDPNQGSGFADVASLLTDLEDGGGTALFSAGDTITIRGAAKGGSTLPDHTFEVGASNTTGSDAFGTTLGDFANFLNAMFGLDESVGPTVGITVDNATGVLTIQGNTGTANDLTLESNHVLLNVDTNPAQPFDLDKAQSADGESVRTTFVGFDSLGTPMTLDLTVVLEDKGTTGTQWRFYAQSGDDSDLDRALGTGTLTFDTNGQLTSALDASVAIDRLGTGATTPQQIALDFSVSESGGGLSALTDSISQVTAVSQDGSPIGSLRDFTVGQDGTIKGVFSNGLLRDLGRVALATFSNPSGLQHVGGNLFQVSANSGDPTVVSAGGAGTGRIIGGALELSNVDLSNEFINLITASTGFSASSRVLSTSDEMLQELLAIVR